MPSLKIYSAAEQVANHLREELAHGAWSGKQVPGGLALSKTLGVGRMTADAALEILEKQGVLVSQGAGKRRLITQSALGSPKLKLGVLPYLIEDYRYDYVMDLQRLLNEEGHTVLYPDRSISQLGGNLKRISKLVESSAADAWVIIAGPRDVLSWFVESKIPSFALFGRRSGLAIPGIGPDKGTAYRTLVRHLLSLGHNRISMIARPLRRLPTPGIHERAFLDELEKSGIQTGLYNLPGWDGRADTLGSTLESLFHLTPPTALLVDEPPLFFSVLHHLARLGFICPQDVSLICSDGDPYFTAQRPSVAHVGWDSRPWVRRITQWVRNVSQGIPDHRQSLTKAEFVEGGSVGPADRKLFPEKHGNTTKLFNPLKTYPPPETPKLATAEPPA